VTSAVAVARVLFFVVIRGALVFFQPNRRQKFPQVALKVAFSSPFARWSMTVSQAISDGIELVLDRLVASGLTVLNHDEQEAEGNVALEAINATQPANRSTPHAARYLSWHHRTLSLRHQNAPSRRNYLATDIPNCARTQPQLQPARLTGMER
jgi:hypothetical protein